MEPPSEEGGDRANEVLNVGAGFWVLLGIQSLKELLRPFVSSMKDGLNSRTILRTELLQLAFSEMHEGEGVEFFDQGTLLFLLHSIGIKKVGKISFPMPETASMLHPWPKEILFDPRASVRKEDLDFRVIEPLLEILSNLSPIGMDPESNGFKGTRGMLRGQGPTHLGLTKVLTPGSLQMHLRPIHEQETKGSALPLPKGTMLLGQPLKTLMKGGVTHRLTRDPLDLLSGPPIRDMEGKANGALGGFLKNMVVGRDGKGLHQRSKGPILFTIYKLRKAVGDHPKRRAKPPRLALMTIWFIAPWLSRKLLRNDLLLKGFHQGGNHVLMDLGTTLFQPLNQPIDCQSRIWYLKYQAKFHRDLAQRIPPFFGYILTLLLRRNPFNFSRKESK